MADQPSDSRHYFDPAVISQLKGLTVRARRVVEGVMLGMHKSPFRGISAEFAQHRSYVPGDDMRHLDWKVYAKSDRLYVKQFRQETSLACHFVVDTSESMNYVGGAALTKFDYASTLAASFAHLVISQQDAVGLITFADTILQTVRPNSQPAHWQQLSHVLLETEPVKPATATSSAGRSNATMMAPPAVRSSVLSEVAERLTH